MRHGLGHVGGVNVDVIVPALNEEQALPKVLADIPASVRRVVVADNGSTDRTAEVARAHGAEIVTEPERGYGAACLRAIAHLSLDAPDVVVFLDGDYSDYPDELPQLVEPIARGEVDFVVGSRTRGLSQAGALTPQQRVGNAIATTALRLLYRAPFTDLGPFRAIRWATLLRLGMRDRNWGWTVEMQIKAARQRVPWREVPVSYRPRIGTSKVSGTLKGSLGAARKILWLLAKHAVTG